MKGLSELPELKVNFKKINIKTETIPFCVNDMICSPCTHFFVISPFHESIFDRCQRFLLTRLSLTGFFMGFVVILIVPGLLTQPMFEGTQILIIIT